MFKIRHRYLSDQYRKIEKLRVTYNCIQCVLSKFWILISSQKSVLVENPNLMCKQCVSQLKKRTFVVCVVCKSNKFIEYFFLHSNNNTSTDRITYTVHISHRLNECIAYRTLLLFNRLAKIQ